MEFKDHGEFREYVREIAERHVRPYAMRVDREDRFARESVEAVFKADLGGVIIPKEYGGLGLSSRHYAIFIEELTRVCPSTAVTFAVTSGLVSNFLIHFAGEHIKKRYLPKLATGENIGAFGLTEPCCGSDAGALRTRAEEAEDGFIINGQKQFITNGSVADFVIVMAKTDPEKGKRGISALLVPTDSEGFHVLKDEDKLGWRGSVTSALSFDDVFVPKENLIGERGAGLKYALASLDAGRVGIAAMGVGTIVRALELATTYVKVNGLQHNEYYSFRVADLVWMLETTRYYTYMAADMKDSGKRYTKYAAVAKLVASEYAMRAVNMLLDLMGVEGVLWSEAERLWRDTKILEIGEGTSEIQRLVLARLQLGG
ncbi:MAG: acyl-CoA dehydrogenase [Thermotogae bacterium]|nr:acyl-CoA dehydrogenase [Thermotogota bacterium]